VNNQNCLFTLEYQHSFSSTFEMYSARVGNSFQQCVFDHTVVHNLFFSRVTYLGR